MEDNESQTHLLVFVLRVYPFIVVFTSEEKQFYSVIRTHVIVS